MGILRWAVPKGKKNVGVNPGKEKKQNPDAFTKRVLWGREKNRCTKPTTKGYYEGLPPSGLGGGWEEKGFFQAGKSIFKGEVTRVSNGGGTPTMKKKHQSR